MLWGPTFSIAEWRCSVCEHYCGSSHHCDHNHHQSSTGHSWQLHRNILLLPVEVFHVWYAAPSNQCSRWILDRNACFSALLYTLGISSWIPAHKYTSSPTTAVLWSWWPVGSLHSPAAVRSNNTIITSLTEHTILSHTTLQQDPTAASTFQL